MYVCNTVTAVTFDLVNLNQSMPNQDCASTHNSATNSDDFCNYFHQGKFNISAICACLDLQGVPINMVIQ